MAAKKKEIRFNIDENYLKELEQRLGSTSSTEISREALAVLKWAADEVSEGRVILSAQKDGKNVERLFTPGLAQVKVSSSSG